MSAALRITPSASTILSTREYIDHMARLRLFRDDAVEPEHNLRVLSAWRALESAWLGHRDLQVHLFLDRYGFHADPMDGERAGLNVALGTPLVDPCLPVDCATLGADLPQLAEAVADAGLCVLTDTFCCVDGYPAAPAPGLLAVHSPVAQAHPSFDAYVDSLSKHRRAKLRRLERSFIPPRFRHDITPTPLSPTELDFAWAQLQRRWGEHDAPYAFAQTLWTHAVSQAMPERVLFARLYDRDQLVFVQTMIVRQGGLFAQSIFKSEDAHLDGVAPWVDFASVRALCGSRLNHLDPSCRATWDDPSAIGIAKRATVNCDRIKPLLALGHVPDDARVALSNAQVAGDPA